MPFVIKCSECAYIFYYGSNVDSLEVILKPLKECPNCGKPVEKDLSEIEFEVLPFAESPEEIS